MKRWLAAVLSAVCIFSGGLRALAADTIGLVDYDKLVSAFHKAQIFKDDTEAKEAELEKMKADYAKQIREAKVKQPNNPVAVDQLQKSLKERFEVKLNEYRNVQESQARALENEVTTTIENIAKSKNLSVVVDKRVVLLGGTDITNDVLSRLNASAGVSSPAAKPVTK